MKILVTGATGFIGGELVEELSHNKNYSIIATGRSQTKRYNGYTNVEFVQADLSQDLPEFYCDVCIHCAGLADDRAPEEAYYTNNCKATQLLIASLKNCKTFILISSSSVYDFSDGAVKKEGDASLTKNLSFYGRSKLDAEKIVVNSAINSVYIFRPRAVYGKGDRVLLPRILKQIKHNKFFVPGKLTTMSSLTHIKNLTEAVKVAASSAKSGRHLYNIADRKPYQLISIFEALAFKKYKEKIPFVHIPIAFLKFLIFSAKIFGIKTEITSQSLAYITYNSVLDCSKIYDALNLQCSYEFYKDIDKIEV